MTPVDRSRLPEVGPDPVFRFPRIERRRLTNGLEVRTVVHESAPVVSMALLVRGGLGADPAGKEGLAGLTADMLDEGTGALSAIDVSDALSRIGGDYEVEVGSDATTISLTTLERFGDRAAELLADLVLRPALRDTDFARVRKLRLDRLAQLRTVPQALAENAFDRLLYGDHPYGHMAIGTTASLGTLELSDVVQFHAATFQPQRSTCVMVGPGTHEALAARAERAFGAWRPTVSDASIRVASAVPPPRPSTARRAIVRREGAAQSELRIGHLSATRTGPDYSALLVMNAVLGGQFVSRVNLKLREEKGFTYGAHTGFDWRCGLSPFALEASVHTSSTAEAITDSLRELVDIRGTRPPSADELSLAKASLTRGYPRGFETADQLAGAAITLALYDLPDEYFEQFMPKIAAVTGEDVVRVATQYLDPGVMTTLVVGDAAVIGDSLDALGLGPWQELPGEL